MTTLLGRDVSLLAFSDLSVCCVVLLAAVLFTKRAARKTIANDPPHPVTLSADQLADRRVLATQREAERGFVTCIGCDFKNFARVEKCALCGVPSSSLVSLCPIVDAASDEHAALKPLPSALKWLEWTRQFDNDRKRFVWQRRLAEGGDHSPGYVLRFDLPPEMEPESERGSPKHRERSLSTGYDPCTGVQFELLDPCDFDSTKFPLPPPRSDMANTMEELKHMAVNLAGLDFPTKYAQFINCASALLQAGDRSFLAVHRDYVLEQSVKRVSFAGEGDVSRVSGLDREWLNLLNEKLVDPEVGLFSCSQRSDKTYFINPQSKQVFGSDHLQHFHAAGKLIGRALLEGVVLDFRLCVPLLKMMLGTPVTVGDLEYLDSEMYRNLMWLLDNEESASLELDFTVTQRHGKHSQTLELIPTGRNIHVNEDNKYEFADRKFRFMMFESVAPQLASFLKGFYEVVPQRMLLPFNYKELDYLLCGSEDINVSDWKLHTHLALQPSRRELAWFWDVVEGMSNIDQKRLLQFTTGCSRVPLVGFQGLTRSDGQLCKFTLIDAGDMNSFQNHAGHNTLELPIFKSMSELRTALYAALNKSNVCES